MPVITARTIADKVKKERFIAQSTEAAEQCRRVDLPVIADAEPLDKVLKTWDKERILYFMDETGQSPCAAEVFRPQDKKAALLIGPEGGFSEAELNALRTLPFARGAVLGKPDFKGGNGSGRGFGRLAVCCRRLAGGIKCAFW